MNDSQLPMVSVPVITYNSSKTVVETLDSIYNQTYPTLELIVSDDCSMDNTVQVCRDWIEAHKERFVRTELLTVEKNTGISANLNRAEAACQGEWVKGIAGDDLLLPDCVSDYMDYVEDNPDAVCVFGRLRFFGSTEENHTYYEQQVFDYSFFSLSPQEQLHKLVFERNYVPAATLFAQIKKLRKLIPEGNDERIPLLEDWPKWIRLLQLGEKFYFLDKETVSYRVIGGISVDTRLSMDFFRSNVLFDLLYRYPLWIEENAEQGVNRMAGFISDQYNRRIIAEDEIERLKKTTAYHLGKKLLRPMCWIKSIFRK